MVFIPNKSCTTNLLETYDYITDSINQNEPLDIVYMDFAKAFDKVSHNRLIVKLNSYGFDKILINWIKSFLKNRFQRVVLGNTTSKWLPVLSGVPQGSVLGPLLFVLYINDLPDSIISNCKLFADDTKLFRRITSDSDNSIIQDNLIRLCEWTNKWIMEFNNYKYVVMHIGKSTL